MKRPREPAEVGKILRELRGIRTMTGAAREIGISYSMLTKLEYGIKVPGEGLKKRLADYYGKSEDEIFYTDE